MSKQVQNRWDAQSIELVEKRDGRSYLTVKEIAQRYGYKVPGHVARKLDNAGIAPVARIVQGRGQPAFLFLASDVREALAPCRNAE